MGSKDEDVYLPFLLRNRAVAHTLMKNYEEALDDIDRYLKIDPKGSEGILYKGNVLTLKKDPSAIEYYESQIKENPNLRGGLYLDLGNALPKIYIDV